MGHQLVDYGNKIMEKGDLFIERMNHLILESIKNSPGERKNSI